MKTQQKYAIFLILFLGLNYASIGHAWPHGNYPTHFATTLNDYSYSQSYGVPDFLASEIIDNMDLYSEQWDWLKNVRKEMFIGTELIGNPKIQIFIQNETLESTIYDFSRVQIQINDTGALRSSLFEEIEITQERIISLLNESKGYAVAYLLGKLITQVGLVMYPLNYNIQNINWHAHSMQYNDYVYQSLMANEFHVNRTRLQNSTNLSDSLIHNAGYLLETSHDNRMRYDKIFHLFNTTTQEDCPESHLEFIKEHNFLFKTIVHYICSFLAGIDFEFVSIDHLLNLGYYGRVPLWANFLIFPGIIGLFILGNKYHDKKKKNRVY